MKKKGGGLDGCKARWVAVIAGVAKCKPRLVSGCDQAVSRRGSAGSESAVVAAFMNCIRAKRA